MVGFEIENVEIPVDERKIIFEIGTDLEVSQSKKLVTLTCPIQIFADADKKQRLALIKVRGEFVIENLDELLHEGGVPVPVLASFNGVVISAARGMLRILSKGTAFASAIIPIINPMDVFKDFKPEMAGVSR